MKRTVFMLSLMMIGFMLNAQSLKEKGDAIYDKGEFDSAAEIYSQCMETDDNCLLKYAYLVLRNKFYLYL